ncbi:MAG: response regulator [Candidatus Omnitrophota bacterium]
MARVMIVDDASFSRKTLYDLLTNANFEVVGEADNGRDAIEKYKQLKPDIVTMDIVMPDMEDLDGIAVVSEIMKIDPEAKIVMVTAMSQRSLMIKALQAGAKDYIVKPFHPPRVTEIIRRVLKGKHKL